ncbi:peptide ABC transporter substrate-binding protein [Chengkuizengella marina]|nr:peptide ABC transporter substrate-binding protein [Chengkuizengella marina]
MKSRNKRMMMILAMFIAVMVGLAACSGEESTTSQPSNTSNTGNDNNSDEVSGDEQVLNLTAGEPTALNPGQANYSQDQLITNNIQEGLMRKGLDGATLEYGLAESYEVDGFTYTFKIKEDVIWSNGDPITAHDFEFAWKEAMDPRNASPYSWLFELIALENAAELAYMEVPEDESEAETNIQAAKDAVGIKALDDTTLQVTLTRQHPAFLELTAFPTFFPVNQAFYEQVGGLDGYATEADTMLYSGPFAISEWSHDEKIVLVKNDKYWDKDAVKLDKIVFSDVADENTQVQLYSSNGVDAIRVPNDYVDQYKDSEEATQYARIQTWWFVLNMEADGVEGEFLRNEKFREAMAIGVNREELVNVAFGGLHVPGTGLIPPGLAGATPDQDYRSANPEHTDFLAYDFERAQQLLEEAKAEVGQDLPTLGLSIYERQSKEAQYLQEQYRKLGVNLEITVTDSKIRKSLFNSRDYHIIYAGWFADYDEPSTYLDLFSSTSGFPKNGFAMDEYDALLEQTQNTTDKEEKYKLYAEMESLVLSNFSFIPMSHDGFYSLQKSYVKDVAVHSTGPSRTYKWAYISGK